jgi:hypothetical protein
MTYQQAQALMKALRAENPGKDVFPTHLSDIHTGISFGYTVTIYIDAETEITYSNYDRSYPQYA